MTMTTTIMMLMRVIMMGCDGGGSGRRKRGSCVRCCGLVMGGKMAALALCLSTHVALAGESVSHRKRFLPIKHLHFYEMFVLALFFSF